MADAVLAPEDFPSFDATKPAEAPPSPEDFPAFDATKPTEAPTMASDFPPFDSTKPTKAPLDRATAEADMHRISTSLEGIDNPVAAIRAVRSNKALEATTSQASRDIFTKAAESEVLPKIKSIYGIDDEDKAREKLYSDPSLLNYGSNFARQIIPQSVGGVLSGVRGMATMDLQQLDSAKSDLQKNYGLSPEDAEVAVNKMVEAQARADEARNKEGIAGKFTHLFEPDNPELNAFLADNEDKRKGVPQALIAKGLREKIRAGSQAIRGMKGLTDIDAKLRAAMPNDPRIEGTRIGSFMDGVAQMPGNLITSLAPGIREISNYSQLYDEAFQQAKQVGKDKGIEVTDADAMKAAKTAALINMPLEEMSDLVLFGAGKKLLPKKTLDRIKAFQKARPVASFLAHAALDIATEAGTESAQQVVTNVATGEQWNKGVEQSALGGAGGGAAMGVVHGGMHVAGEVIDRVKERAKEAGLKATADAVASTPSVAQALDAITAKQNYAEEMRKQLAAQQAATETPKEPVTPSPPAAEPPAAAAPAPAPEVKPAPQAEPPVQPQVQPAHPAPAPEPAVDPAAPVAEDKGAVPVVRVPAAEIATRPDLMQFKRSDDIETGVNDKERLAGEWDDLKAGTLLLWEPKNGQEHGLQPGQKYIVANGHHRFEFGARQDVSGYNAQVIREADGYSALDARRLGAEINIADGKGSIQDQARFIRDTAATRGADAALETARKVGARGRQAATIGLHAGDSLFTAFINERVSGEHAAAIAAAAPGKDGAQRLGLRSALAGKSPAESANMAKAAVARTGGEAQTGDLFGPEDPAIAEMEAAAARATQHENALREQIAAVQSAARRPELAAKLGVNVADPEGVKKRIAELKAEVARWEKWPSHPDLLAIAHGESPDPANSASEPKAPGADLFAGREDDPFNLTAESPAEIKAREAREAAEKHAAEEAQKVKDREEQDRQQQQFFVNPGVLAPLSPGALYVHKGQEYTILRDLGSHLELQRNDNPAVKLVVEKGQQHPVEMVQRFINFARVQLSEYLDNVGHPQTVYPTSAPGTTMYVGVGPDGVPRIYVNAREIQSATAGLTDDEAAERIRMALSEEIVHVAEIQFAKENPALAAAFLDSVHADKDLIEFLRSTYPNFDNLAPYQQRAEAARVIVQQRWYGKITEAIRGYLSGLRDWLANYVLGIDAKPSAVKQYIAGIEDILFAPQRKTILMHHGTNEGFRPGEIKSEGTTRTSANDDETVGVFLTPDRSFAANFGDSVHSYEVTLGNLLDVRTDPEREFTLPEFVRFLNNAGLDITEADVQREAKSDVTVKKPNQKFGWADGWAPVMERLSRLIRDRGFDSIADMTWHESTGLPVEQFNVLHEKNLSHVIFAGGYSENAFQARVNGVFERIIAGDDTAFDELEILRNQLFGPRETGGELEARAPRFFSAAEFEKFFEAAFLARDYEAILAAVKASDAALYVPLLKRLMRAQATDPDAAHRADWLGSVFRGVRPADAPAAPGSTPPPTPNTATPPPAPTPPPPPQPNFPGFPQRPPPPPPPAPPNGRHPFNLPGLVYLTNLLGSSPRINKLLTRTRGRFVIAGPDIGPVRMSIELNKDIFKHPMQAARTLAHEIGHFFDFIARHVEAGQLAQKVAPLRNWRTIFGPLWDWSGHKISEIQAMLRDEAIQLSRSWRGDFGPGDAYRNSANELYADFISALLNNPTWTFTVAPRMSAAFFAGLEAKPAVEEAFNVVNELLRGNTLWDALRTERAEDVSKGVRDMIAASIRAREEMGSFRRAWSAFYGGFLNRFGPMMNRAGGYWASMRRRMQDFGRGYVERMELNATYAERQISLMHDQLNAGTFLPLRAAGISTTDLDTVLRNRRIIHERTATGLWLEGNPDDARETFTWMAQTAGLHHFVDEIASMPDSELYNFGARLVWEIHQSGAFDDVYRAAQQRGAPDFAERGLFAFDVSGFMLNPQGFDVESAERELQALQATLGPLRWHALQQATQNYYDAMRKIVLEANRLGLFRPKTWQERIAPNLRAYVPFMPIDYFTGHISASVSPGRVGTSLPIMSPHVAGQLKMGAMLKRIQRQKQVLLTIDYFRTEGREFGFEGEMHIHTERLNEQQRNEIKKYGGNVMGFYRNGEWTWAQFQDGAAVSAIEMHDPEDLQSLINFGRSHSLAWRLYFTTYSVGFTLWNALRTARQAFESHGLKNVTAMRRAFPDARAYARAIVHGEPMTANLRRLVEAGAIPPPERSLAGQMSANDLERMIIEGAVRADSMLGKTPHEATNPIKRFIRMPLGAILDRIAYLSGIVESIPKIATEASLSRIGVPPDKAAAFARLEGIPNPSIAGKYNTAMEVALMFFRVHVQGLRAMRTRVMSPETRSGYLTRVMTTQIITKTFYIAAAAGLVDAAINLLGRRDKKQKDWEELVKRTTPYKLEMDDMYYLGWVKPGGGYAPPFGHEEIPLNWTPLGIRVPHSDDGRFWSPVSHIALTKLFNSPVAPVDTTQRSMEVAKTTLIPGTNPGFDLISAAWSLPQNEPPRDNYRGRPIMEPDQWKAGYMSRTFGLGEYFAKQVGFGNRVPNDDLNWFWKMVRNTPGLGRLVVLDNYAGVREQRAIELEQTRVDATARQMRGHDTERAMLRRFQLMKKGSEEGDKASKRTAAEEGEYERLREWYNEYYEGSADNPGLFHTLKAKAAGQDVDWKYARDRLDEEARRALTEAREKHN